MYLCVRYIKSGQLDVMYLCVNGICIKSVQLEVMYLCVRGICIKTGQ